MKTLLLSLASLVVCLTARASLFIDPAGGTTLWADDALHDDEVVRARPLGFEFDYFGETVSAIDVSTNGNLNFAADSDYSNEKTPTTVARISPLWDDLALLKGSGDAVIEKVSPGKYYSVTWRVHENGQPATRHWFQVVIFGAAQTIAGRSFQVGDIVFSYAEIGASFAKNVATVGLDDGNATIIPAPGAAADTAHLVRGEAGALPTAPGGFIQFRLDDVGDYVAITQVNFPPQAADDIFYTTNRESLTIDVVANDLDANADSLTIVSVTQGALGNVTIKNAREVTYRPGADFAGTDFFEYTVRDPFGLTSTARVTLFPYRASRGMFSGMIVDQADEDGVVTPTAEGTGFLRVQLTGNGGFTGVLHYGGLVTPLRGTFNDRGDFTLSFERVVDDTPQTITLRLHLDFTRAQSPLTGTITNGDLTSTIDAGRTRYSTTKDPAPQAGKYTFQIRPEESAGGPRGVGYGAMDVGRSGSLVMSGRLGDGKRFSFGGHIVPGGKVAFFVRSIAPGAKLAHWTAGWLTFDETQALSDCAGELQFFDAENSDEAKPTFVAARYLAPRRLQRIVTLADTPRNALIDIGDGTYAPEITLDAQNRVTVALPNEEGIRVTILAATGLFSGSFQEESPDTKRMVRRTFGGAFVRKAGAGGGLYCDADGIAGAVWIKPPAAD